MGEVMHRKDDIDSLREELLEMVADHLTPVARRYGYSDVPLETNIKWRPQVLVLGNYSSGKSTLINEFLGADIQPTGQAPTDDSFTVITYDDSPPPDSFVSVTEERDGKYLLNDPEYPFEMLKKHGERFAAHFRLKKVNSPFLKNLAIIDTPGMLDSITERDRGYNYQDVVGDLAQIADLVLVLFDPHKAGTVREAHISIRDTLPARTFEDRVLFVLNRVDECTSLSDLIRVYGTLCWNLSQITGRKDIPTIHLTYSPHATVSPTDGVEGDAGYLHYLENERVELKRAILRAPRRRLDNLATFVETHGERLSHFLEALINYRKESLLFRVKYALAGLFVSLLCGGATAFAISASVGMAHGSMLGAGVAVAGGILVLWMTALLKYFASMWHRNRLRNLDTLTALENQTRSDTWQAIREVVSAYLKKTRGRFPVAEVKQDYADVRAVCDKGAREIRETIHKLFKVTPEEKPPTTKGSLFNLRPFRR
jgi:EH domain-containing protein 1